jgi:hypothetical protein
MMMGLCEVWDGRILDGMVEMSGWEEGRRGERVGMAMWIYGLDNV